MCPSKSLCGRLSNLTTKGLTLCPSFCQHSSLAKCCKSKRWMIKNMGISSINFARLCRIDQQSSVKKVFTQCFTFPNVRPFVLAGWLVYLSACLSVHVHPLCLMLLATVHSWWCCCCCVFNLQSVILFGRLVGLLRGLS